ILDLFSPDAEAPFRLEFFGDEIESIRPFAPHTQRSLGAVPVVEIMAAESQVPAPPAEGNGRHSRSPEPALERGHLCDYLPADAWTVLVEPEDLDEQAKHYLERVADARGLFSVTGVFQQLLPFP